MNDIGDLIDAALARARNPKDEPPHYPIYLTRDQMVVVERLEEARLWQQKIDATPTT